MKCPKCGYLGFVESERCRNCSYEFALAATPPTPDLTLRDGSRDVRSTDDLHLADVPSLPAGRPTSRMRPGAVPLKRLSESSDAADAIGELPLFVSDGPLITKPSAPRAPLSVRRATPDVPKLKTVERVRPSRFEFNDHDLSLGSSPAITVGAPAPAASTVVRVRAPEARPASPVQALLPAGLGV
jgi:hypothetical protein